MTDLQTIVRWQDVDAESLAGRTVVVIDVLRWSTVVVTALANGAAGVEAFASAEDAALRAAELRAAELRAAELRSGARHGDIIAGGPHETRGVLLGGERATLALPGFDLGNSPGDYTRERVAGRVVVMTSTNGTQAMAAARLAHEVLVAAFVNLDPVVDGLRAALAAGRGITLLAAGTEGVESPEDTGCAGAIASGLLRPPAPAATADAVTLRAIAAWEDGERDPARIVGAAPHAATLTANGFAADIAAAARLSVPALLVVPRLHRDGRIRLTSPAV